MNIKRLVATVGMAIALVFGGLLITSTFAQSEETPTPGVQDTERPPRPDSPRAGHHRGGLLDVAAEALGMTVAELVAELDDDTSMADVAAAQGIDTATLVDAVVAQAEEHMQAAVENGRLTREEADERLAQLREDVTTRINEPGLPERPERERGPHNGCPNRGNPRDGGYPPPTSPEDVDNA
jgi:hypothetical protein